MHVHRCIDAPPKVGRCTSQGGRSPCKVDRCTSRGGRLHLQRWTVAPVEVHGCTSQGGPMHLFRWTLQSPKGREQSTELFHFFTAGNGGRGRWLTRTVHAAP